MTHSFTCRVYYEDTDMAGIVYHANYLKFIERARSEMVREAGVSQAALKAGQGMVFAVRRMEMDFFLPARFEDLLTVTTEITALKGASFDLEQVVWRGEDKLFRAGVQVVSMTETGRAVRIPADIRQKLSGTGH
ncbi:tol-pal system-associated acyl-CoA thioesterase [Nioella nitratireducens]|uniref:tol-pal system-associated acyl-CoA thioesterase n=1 Tax=Nioella nitratireducens TaxID=1287720 RepID=UPI0008FD371F|nr:tol-pal system-associated acyl-CoA thioesterase [Nioella nitratireducens]